MNDATARLQRQLSFPPIAKRVLALVARCMDAAGGDVLEARHRMARRLRRLAHRQVERVRFMGGPTVFTWWAADCAAKELASVDWQWLACHWVGQVVNIEKADAAS